MYGNEVQNNSTITSQQGTGMYAKDGPAKDGASRILQAAASSAPQNDTGLIKGLGPTPQPLTLEGRFPSAENTLKMHGPLEPNPVPVFLDQLEYNPTQRQSYNSDLPSSSPMGMPVSGIVPPTNSMPFSKSSSKTIR